MQLNYQDAAYLSMHRRPRAATTMTGVESVNGRYLAHIFFYDLNLVYNLKKYKKIRKHSMRNSLNILHRVIYKPS